MTISDSLKLAVLNIPGFTAAGSLGTAPNTVDICSHYNVNQTVAGIAIGLPTPTNTLEGNIIFIRNTGTQTLTVAGEPIPAGKGKGFQFTGTTWASFTPGPVISTAIPLSDGLANDTTNRQGAAGTTGQVSDAGHRHPIERLTVFPAFPGVTVDASTTLSSATGSVLYSTEETITYAVQVTLTYTATGAWRTIAFNTMTGYNATHISFNGTYSGVTAIMTAGIPDVAFVWAGATFYCAPRTNTINTSLTQTFVITYTLN